MQYFLGLDLGQRMDRSAVAVVRQVQVVEGDFDWVRWMQPRVTRWDVEHLQRLRLGTSYTAAVAAVRELTRRPELKGQCSVVADATGPGLPVVEMLRSADLGAEVIPVMITSGATPHYTRGVWHVPRRDLMVHLRGRLERGELRIAAELKEGGHLIEELANVRWDGRGYSRGHDDLAFALALGCWRAASGSGGRVHGRLL